MPNMLIEESRENNNYYNSTTIIEIENSQNTDSTKTHKPEEILTLDNYQIYSI